MIAQKKWALILFELESSIQNLETSEDCKNLLNKFSSIDENYRDEKAPQSYKLMWKVALRSGKLSLAESYAKKFIDYLIDLKRIPQLKSFLRSLNDEGLFKRKSEKYLNVEKIILGKDVKITQDELAYFDILIEHPEHWKKSSEFLKQFLLIEDDWSLEQWKFCYEYILINYFDKDIFISLLEKSRLLKNSTAENKIIKLLDSKKIKFHTRENFSKAEEKPVQKKLHLDYDQMALELLSGLKEPNIEEQKRVINSLKFISDQELLSKGQDIVVAFELLGMEQVVYELCQKMLELQVDIKDRVITFYVWAQALSNNGDFYKTIDLIDDLFQKEPLNAEEGLAFKYLKAEACLKIKRTKMAKELYLEIKKINPHYRLVGERLIEIEAS